MTKKNKKMKLSDVKTIKEFIDLTKIEDEYQIVNIILVGYSVIKALEKIGIDY